MWTIIISICLVFIVCAPVWALSKYLKINLPKFLLPMLAGISLLSFQAYLRYTWGDRTIDALPEEIVLLKEYRHSNVFEPWTYLVPRVSHMIAADTRQTRHNDLHPEIILGETVMIQEHQPTLNMTVMEDCGKELVSVVPTTKIVNGKNPLDLAQWTRKEEFRFLVNFYCKG